MAITIKNNGGKVTPKSEFDAHLGAPKTTLVTKPAKAQVQVMKVSTKKGGEKAEQLVMEKEEVVHKGITIPKDDLCVITVEGGHTANLGNYESARIGVSLQVPCSKSELDVTYEFATEWVSAKMQEAIAAVKG
jgi:hypothetical protein